MLIWPAGSQEQAFFFCFLPGYKDRTIEVVVYTDKEFYNKISEQYPEHKGQQEKIVGQINEDIMRVLTFCETNLKHSSLGVEFSLQVTTMR